MNDGVNEPPEPPEADAFDDPFSAGGGMPIEPEAPHSSYPAGPPTSYPVEPVDPATTTGQTAALGYGLGPPPDSGGEQGHRAGPYPAGPPQPPQPQFGRRPHQRGPQPDADGYYPSDYYLGTDWTRVVLGGLATVALALGIIGLGYYLFDRFDPTAEDSAIPVNATPTPLALVAVFECAGERPAGAVTAPETVLIAGRNGDSKWLAFRNPQAPPRQLWVAAIDMPEFDPTTVGIVSCASSPAEFPTPLGAVTPAPTPPPDDSSFAGTGPTPTPLPAPTAVPQATITPVPTALPTPTASPMPTEPPPPPDDDDGGDG